MTFQLVYYSQQDPKWKQDILGFGGPGDTIGYVGCALTSTAMLVSGHGYTETPQTLNQKLKNVNGFVSAGIRWSGVTQIFPQISVKSNISCINADAPLDLIDSSLAAGQPVIVMVDSTPAAGLLTHWVVLYAREGNDYLMLDPWPYQTDVTKKTYLMPRYSQGNPLQRSIMHIIIYECYTASGGIALPGGGSTPATPPATSATTARVKAEATAGLNIRSSIDTSSTSNIIAHALPGAVLTLIEADGAAKIGAVNQWVRVRDDQNHEGFCAAWYLERIPVSNPTPPPPPVPPAPPAGQLVVMVKPTVGKFGAKIYQTASSSSKILLIAKMRAQLVVLENAKAAKAKIGISGKWLNVQAATGEKGYVDAALVKIP